MHTTTSKPTLQEIRWKPLLPRPNRSLARLSFLRAHALHHPSQAQLRTPACTLMEAWWDCQVRASLT